MKDPLEETDVRLARPWVWAAGFVGLAIAYAIAFPKQFSWVVIILALPVIIFLHELGHFVTAKRSGMKVTEFFIGFGPRVWSMKRGETEYGVKAIPLGGYCRIIGMTNLEDVAPEDEPRAYRSKKFLPKVVVAGAGSAVHFTLALLLMFGVLWIHGNRQESTVTTTLAAVEAGSPADRAGLQPGDRVVSIGGTAVDSWDDVYNRLIEGKAGDVVTFGLERGGTTRTVDVTLAVIGDENRARAGIQASERIPQLSFGAAAIEAPRQVWQIGTESVKALGSMFSFSGISNYWGVLTGDEQADENQRFLSPVGAVRVGSQAAAAGWVEAAILAALINVFIGLFNLVPLLPFDGGHIAIATYERIASAIRRRPVRVDAAKLLPITGVVVAVLAFIFMSSLFLDITNPADNPF